MMTALRDALLAPMLSSWSEPCLALRQPLFLIHSMTAADADESAAGFSCIVDRLLAISSSFERREASTTRHSEPPLPQYRQAATNKDRDEERDEEKMRAQSLLSPSAIAKPFRKVSFQE